MPETTDLIERLNKRAENGRVFHTDRKLFAEAATALSENIETINGQAMDLATLRARLASCEAALVPFLPAYQAYVETMTGFTMSGETSAERRFSEGERRDTASEAAYEAMAAITFQDLCAVSAALTKGGEDAE